MRCAYCPLFARYESEDDCYEVCGLFGDGWDNRFQYEDKEGTTIGCYIEKCYITKRAKEIDEQISKMANYHKVEREEADER